jgi:hypothetical protein
MKLFVDRGYKRNFWYVVKGGNFIAGPFERKGEATDWMKNQ